MLLLGIALWGVGMGAQESILKAAVTSMVPRDSRATGYGLFECAFGVAWFLGSWLMGVLYDVSLPAMVAVSVTAQLAAHPAVSLRIRAADRRGVRSFYLLFKNVVWQYGRIRAENMARGSRP